MTPAAKAEFACAYALKYRGVGAKAIGRKRLAWDVITKSGVKVEVKHSALKHGRWSINVSPDQIAQADFLTVALTGWDGEHGAAQRMWVVLPMRLIKSPARPLHWSWRSVINKYSRYIGNWDLILRKERGRHAK
jgi:hypothetical protein